MRTASWAHLPQAIHMPRLAASPLIAVSVFVCSALHVPRAVPPRAGSICSRQASRPTKGFATKPKRARPNKVPIVKLEQGVADAIAVLQGGEQSLEAYLNPKHLEPEALADISERLQAGKVVVLRDAFRQEFAEMVFAELQCKHVAWEHNEAYFPDGYAHRHQNVYDRGSWSARLNRTLEVFSSSGSTRLMESLTGRDCSGETVGAPSWYKEGDHSLPHTDWVGQRTVSYVWHLSKNWKPEWGGALYWAQNDHAVATYPASFNTLVLFSVMTSRRQLHPHPSSLLPAASQPRPRPRPRPHPH